MVVRPSPADRVPGDRPEDVKVEYPWPRYAESDAWEATTASLSRRLQATLLRFVEDGVMLRVVPNF